MPDLNNDHPSVPLAALRAHADLGLDRAANDAIVNQMRDRLHAPAPGGGLSPKTIAGALRTRMAHPPRSIVIPSAITVLLGLGLALALTSGSNNASAAALFPVLRQPPDTTPTDERDLRMAQAEHPALNIADARKVLADAEGTLWIMPATDGDICLVQKPLGAATRVPFPGHPHLTLVGTGISCTSTATAAERGVFIGVPGPGRWDYGVAPADVTNVHAVVNGATVSLELSADNAFRVSPDATSVTVGDATPVTLPGPSPAS